MDLEDLREAYEAVTEASHPSATLQRLDELKLAADIAIRQQVVEMMTDPFGMFTWTEVGSLIGVSRQAAKKRFGADVDREWERKRRIPWNDAS